MSGMIRLGLDEARWSASQPERRELTLDQFLDIGLVDPPAIAGVTVNQNTANQIAAYWNGITIIAQTVAMLDRHLYRRVGDDDRERATSHPAYSLVHDRPNPYATGMQFWGALLATANSWGDGYAEIEWDRAMRPLALWNIPPGWMDTRVESVKVDGVEQTRVYHVFRGQERFEDEDIIHIPGMGFDGIRGYSPVRLARESLGLTMAQERFGAALFGNGAWPGVALESPDKLSPEAQERLRQSFDKVVRGSGRAHRTLVLEQGMKVSKPITVPPDDAQFLESRNFQIEEIARWLNLPPHKLKHRVGERPGGNIEQSQIDFLTDSIMPWTTRVEQECDRKLIAKSQRGTFYTEHNYEKMLKADSQTRMANWKTLHDMGVVSPQLIAQRENLPKPPERPAAPASAPATAEPVPNPSPSAPADPVPAVAEQTPIAAARPAMVVSFRALLLDVVGRFQKREAFHAERASKKGARAFGGWLAEFYGGEEEALYRDCLVPALGFGMVALGSDGDAQRAAAGFARDYMEHSKAQLEEIQAREIGQAVPRLLKRWESARAAEVVDRIIAAVAAEEKADA